MSNEQQALIEVAERLLPERPYQEAVDLGELDRWWRDAFSVLLNRRHELLLPCPFCGSRMVGALTESTRSGDVLGVIGCALCGAEGPSACDRDEMAAWWNRRVQISENRESIG